MVGKQAMLPGSIGIFYLSSQSISQSSISTPSPRTKLQNPQAPNQRPFPGFLWQAWTRRFWSNAAQRLRRRKPGASVASPTPSSQRASLVPVRSRRGRELDHGGVREVMLPAKPAAWALVLACSSEGLKLGVEGSSYTRMLLYLTIADCNYALAL